VHIGDDLDVDGLVLDLVQDAIELRPLLSGQRDQDRVRRRLAHGFSDVPEVPDDGPSIHLGAARSLG
jgi:hypothetical protein